MRSHTDQAAFTPNQGVKLATASAEIMSTPIYRVTEHLQENIITVENLLRDLERRLAPVIIPFALDDASNVKAVGRSGAPLELALEAMSGRVADIGVTLQRITANLAV